MASAEPSMSCWSICRATLLLPPFWFLSPADRMALLPLVAATVLAGSSATDI